MTENKKLQINAASALPVARNALAVAETERRETLFQWDGGPEAQADGEQAELLYGVDAGTAVATKFKTGLLDNLRTPKDGGGAQKGVESGTVQLSVKLTWPMLAANPEGPVTPTPAMMTRLKGQFMYGVSYRIEVETLNGKFVEIQEWTKIDPAAKKSSLYTKFDLNFGASVREHGMTKGMRLSVDNKGGDKGTAAGLMYVNVYGIPEENHTSIVEGDVQKYTFGMQEHQLTLDRANSKSKDVKKPSKKEKQQATKELAKFKSYLDTIRNDRRVLLAKYQAAEDEVAKLQLVQGLAKITDEDITAAQDAVKTVVGEENAAKEKEDKLRISTSTDEARIKTLKDKLKKGKGKLKKLLKSSDPEEQKKEIAKLEAAIATLEWKKKNMLDPKTRKRVTDVSESAFRALATIWQDCQNVIDNVRTTIRFPNGEGLLQQLDANDIAREKLSNTNPALRRLYSQQVTLKADKDKDMVLLGRVKTKEKNLAGAVTAAQEAQVLAELADSAAQLKTELNETELLDTALAEQIIRSCAVKCNHVLIDAAGNEVYIPDAEKCTLCDQSGCVKQDGGNEDGDFVVWKPRIKTDKVNITVYEKQSDAFHGVVLKINQLHGCLVKEGSTTKVANYIAVGYVSDTLQGALSHRNLSNELIDFVCTPELSAFDQRGSYTIKLKRQLFIHSTDAEAVEDLKQAGKKTRIYILLFVFELFDWMSDWVSVSSVGVFLRCVSLCVYGLHRSAPLDVAGCTHRGSPPYLPPFTVTGILCDQHKPRLVSACLHGRS